MTTSLLVCVALLSDLRDNMLERAGRDMDRGRLNQASALMRDADVIHEVVALLQAMGRRVARRAA